MLLKRFIYEVMMYFRKALFFIVTLAVTTGCSKFPLVVSTDKCYVDNMIGATVDKTVFTASAISDVTVQGWLADTISGKVPSKMAVQFISANNQMVYSFEGNTGIKRPDVASAFKSPNIASAGFEVKGVFKSAPAGEYAIQVIGEMDGKLLVCRTAAKLIVK